MNTATPATSAARLLLRLAIGALFVAHGLQKFNEYTLAGTAGAFAQMGIPAAEVAAPIVASVELVGGILLIIGLLTRPAAFALAANMAGALFMVHLGSGVFVENGGFELVLALGAAALALALAGPGKVSLDAALFGRRNSALAQLA